MSISSKLRIHSNPVLQIAAVPGRNEFWLLTPERLLLFNPNFTSYILFSVANTGFTHISTTPVNGGRLVLAGPAGVKRCEFVAYSLTCSSVVDLPSNAPITALLVMTNGTTLIASDKLYNLAPHTTTYQSLMAGGVRPGIPFCVFASLTSLATL